MYSTCLYYMHQQAWWHYIYIWLITGPSEVSTIWSEWFLWVCKIWKSVTISTVKCWSHGNIGLNMSIFCHSQIWHNKRSYSDSYFTSEMSSDPKMLDSTFSCSPFDIWMSVVSQVLTHTVSFCDPTFNAKNRPVSY